MIDAHKGLRLVQGALLLGALLTGLAWFEDAKPGMQEVGQEDLLVNVQAPVENPRGPWEEGMAFTDEHEGIPTRVAPNLTMEVRHRASGVTVLEPQWEAELVIEAAGESGDRWWSTRQPVPVNASEEAARVHLHVPSVLANAQALDEEAGVPSSLSLRVDVEHEATTVVQGDEETNVLMASLDLIPREGFVVTETKRDASSYAKPGEEDVDWLPLALLGGVVLAEGPAFALRRDRDAWEGKWGISPSRVEGLEVPKGSPRASVEEVLSLARERGGELLVDRERGRLVVPGSPRVWGSLPSSAGEEERDQDHDDQERSRT